MKKGLKIYLFRHGQTTFNRDKKFTGLIDSKLTDQGKNHAKKISQKLKNKKFEVAIHTKLSRSKDTLKQVLSYHKDCKVLKDDRMIERNYGIYSGMSHKKFIEKFGNKRYEEVHRGYRAKLPEGENFYQVEKRVKEFIRWLKKYMKENQVNVAISAHGNSIRLFRKIIEKSSVKEMQKWAIPYDKVFVYEI